MAEGPFGQEQAPGPLRKDPGEIPRPSAHRTDIRHGICPPVKTLTGGTPTRIRPDKGYRTTASQPAGCRTPLPATLLGRWEIAGGVVPPRAEFENGSGGTEHANLAA
jgi:hypothetical protein